MAAATAVVYNNRARVAFSSTEKDVSRIADAFPKPTSPTLGPPAPSHSPRPEHKRRRSKMGSFDPLRDLGHTFQCSLPRTWGTPEAFKALARDFFAVTAGFSAGHRIRNYPLDRAATARMALALSNVVQTTDIMMILDEADSALYVIHTQILNNRSVNTDDTLYVKVDHGVPSLMPAGRVDFVSDASHHLEHLLRQSNRQVFQTSDFGWNALDTAYRMKTLGDWLLDFPVCYVIDSSFGQDLADLRKLINKDQECWTLSVSAEGKDPEHDHTFEGCQLPTTVFNNDAAWTVRTTSPQETSLAGKRSSLNDMQDRVQSKLLNRLDAAPAAMAVWSDVTCTAQGPAAY